VRLSLDMLNLAPLEVSIPLLAAPYRAPLGGFLVAIHIIGPTGVGKSELAARVEQHFGSTMHAKNLSSWMSTGNALAELSYLLADVVLVVDDLAPDISGSTNAAERVIRGSGNGAGRLRLNREARLRPSRPPRSLLLSTGEDDVQGHSLAARVLGIRLEKGMVDWDKMTELQKYGARGDLAAAMSGYLMWVSSRLPFIHRNQENWVRRIARSFTGEGHLRSADAAAELLIGLGAMLIFAAGTGAVDRTVRRDLWRLGVEALASQVQRQRVRMRSADPSDRFCAILRGTLSGGRVHVLHKDGKDSGGPPTASPSAWGWVDRGGSWQPQGTCVGYLEGEDLYLFPSEAYRLYASEMGTRRETALTEGALFSRLGQAGLLGSTESERHTIRKVLAGKSQPVLHLRSSELFKGG
jgi:hypothetical protein